ncbi:hypothetical protein BDZ97DRAFT_1823046 [Flammula alnicola]|nr:hypothetical protein BDZ97DRAFT_1823046 [Flammula alnicola]
MNHHLLFAVFALLCSQTRYSVSNFYVIQLILNIAPISFVHALLDYESKVSAASLRLSKVSFQLTLSRTSLQFRLWFHIPDYQFLHTTGCLFPALRG